MSIAKSRIKHLNCNCIVNTVAYAFHTTASSFIFTISIQLIKCLISQPPGSMFRLKTKYSIRAHTHTFCAPNEPVSVSLFLTVTQQRCLPGGYQRRAWAAQWKKRTDRDASTRLDSLERVVSARRSLLQQHTCIRYAENFCFSQASKSIQIITNAESSLRFLCSIC